MVLLFIVLFDYLDSGRHIVFDSFKTHLCNCTQSFAWMNSRADQVRLTSNFNIPQFP